MSEGVSQISPPIPVKSTQAFISSPIPNEQVSFPIPPNQNPVRIGKQTQQSHQGRVHPCVFILLGRANPVAAVKPY